MGYYGHFQQYFRSIMAVSFVGRSRKNGLPRENYRPNTSNLQTLSHSVISSTSRYGRESNSLTLTVYYI